MEENMDRSAENELPLFGNETEDQKKEVVTTAEPVEESVAADIRPEETPAEAPVAAIPAEAEIPPEPAPELKPEPVTAPGSGSVSPAGKIIPPGLQPTPAFGSFLRRVREANGISLDEVSRITRIKKGYLEAVEQENYQDLPAVVYTLAYINVLADFYGVDAEGKAILTSEVRKHLEYEAPEENKTVVGYEPSAENQILLRRILFAGAGVIVLLAVLITLAVLFFTAGGGAASGAEGSAPAGGPNGPGEAQLVELQPAPALQTHVLPVPKR